ALAGGELHPKERVPFLRAERHHRELLLPRARVDVEQQLAIGRSDGAQGDHAVPQFREGKTPWRHTMKLIPRNGCRFSCGWKPPAEARMPNWPLVPGLP